MPTISQSPEWRALTAHFRDIEAIHMRDLFAEDPQRFTRFSIKLADLIFDYSKNRINETTLKRLIELADTANLREKIDAMFNGEKINKTEERAVLHVALRNRSNRAIYVDGVDVMASVNHVLDKIRTFSDSVREGHWKGYSGKSITDVVNIGIGGSDLGPKMVCEALKPYGNPRLRRHFVSNVDGADLAQVLSKIDQETALFLIASKTFTTQETMMNARSARSWFLSKANDSRTIAKHFIAVSTNRPVAREFGVDPDNIFEFWDWVGGRYSLWSAIGLSIALHVGMDRFVELLEGAHEIDEHFRQTPFQQNIPVIMALLGIWYNNFFGAQSHAILPYDQNLQFFPAFLQQCDMESNGKSVKVCGETVDYQTGPVIWGEPGTNGQHAFFQLIHQGTKLIPCDFIAACESHYPQMTRHHEVLLSNFFAQSKALMTGKSAESVKQELTTADFSDANIEQRVAAKVFTGNRPSNSLLFKKLTPRALGSLIALYEHKVFVQGVIWGINSFDQMGVELGKQLAHTLLKEMASDRQPEVHDSSTNGLVDYFLENRG